MGLESPEDATGSEADFAPGRDADHALGQVAAEREHQPGRRQRTSNAPVAIVSEPSITMISYPPAGRFDTGTGS